MEELLCSCSCFFMRSYAARPKAVSGRRHRVVRMLVGVTRTVNGGRTVKRCGRAIRLVRSLAVQDCRTPFFTGP